MNKLPYRVVPLQEEIIDVESLQRIYPNPKIHINQGAQEFLNRTTKVMQEGFPMLEKAMNILTNPLVRTATQILIPKIGNMMVIKGTVTRIEDLGMGYGEDGNHLPRTKEKDINFMNHCQRIIKGVHAYSGSSLP
jgi:hypothetical protein